MPSILSELLCKVRWYTKIQRLSDNILIQFLRAGNEQYTIADLMESLKILLAAGAHKENVMDIPGGYLTPVMLAHADNEAIHARVVKMISNYGKHKIA